MNQKQTLRFNRHQVRGKLCGAYVFISKNTPLWIAVHVSNTAGVAWSVATFEAPAEGANKSTISSIYLRPFSEGVGWKSIRLEVVKSGAFRLYVSLDACPPLCNLPKKFSVEGITVVTGGLVAWTGTLPEPETVAEAEPCSA